MSKESSHKIDDVYFPQPIGLWKRRGAMDCFIQIATGNVVNNWPDKMQEDNDGFHVWHYWANANHPEKLWDDARVFLGDKFDRQVAKNGEHPLHRLFLQGKIKPGKQWIAEASWPIDAKKDTDNFWHCLAWSGCIETFKSFYEYLSIKSINEKDDAGMTPAMIALHRGGMDFLNYWLFLGADPDISDNQKRTLLHHVALYGDVSIYSQVQDIGANDTLKNEKGQTAENILKDKMLHITKEEIDSVKSYWNNKYFQKNIF